jgi:hypothetical protein
MIHCWREVSLAGLPRTDTGQDECYALLFESTFDLAEAEPECARVLGRKIRAGMVCTAGHALVWFNNGIVNSIIQ